MAAGVTARRARSRPLRRRRSRGLALELRRRRDAVDLDDVARMKQLPPGREAFR